MKTRLHAYEGPGRFVFVSYSHKDEETVYPIIEYLIKSGYNVWYDEGIPLVLDFGSVLYEQIKSCTSFILFRSRNSVDSPFVVKETLHALNFRKKIIQIALDDAELPPSLAFQLPATTQYLSVKTEQQEFFGKLTAEITDCVGSSPRPVPLPPKPGNKKKVAGYIIAALMAAMLAVGVWSVSARKAAEPPELPGYVEDNGTPEDGEGGIGQKTDQQEQTQAHEESSADDLPVPSFHTYRGTSSGYFSKQQQYYKGDRFLLGSYEQDNDTSDGKEAIEWRVISEGSGRVMVVSEYALDAQPFNSTRTAVTWESCSLRSWLNGSFISEAFSEDELTVICSSSINNPSNPWHGTSCGGSTTDRVFVLSAQEVDGCFSDSQSKMSGFDVITARLCYPTEYAVARGAFSADDNGLCWRWLRTSGKDNKHVTIVNTKGEFNDYIYYVDKESAAIRPAMWVSVG